MEKLTISISPEDWGHLITKYNADSAKVSLADFTEGTVNVESDVTGSLTKRKGGPNYNATLLASAPKDQFEAIFSDGARHLLVVQSGEVKYSSGDTIFNTVVNGTGFSATGNFEFATTQDRVYMGNGINAPQVYDRATLYGGVSYTAPRMKAMGVQAPSSAPVAGAPTAGGSVPNGAHTYKVTYLYYDSEESNGSAVSGVQTAGAGNNTIPLTSIPIGGYGVTARKIYRDNNDGLWLHLATLQDNTTTTYSDTLAVGATPTEIPTDHFTPPSFARVTLWLDQLWVSGVPGDPSTLFYSDTAMPDLFPTQNQILCNQEDPITAHTVYFDRMIVFNRRSMGQILGKTSDTYRYAAIPSSVGCVDNRTLQIRVIEGVPILIWLSDRGFYSYDGNSINYISDEIEDLVNFNIQQALQQKNTASQSSFGGTPENGISLTEIPGSITTRGYLNGTSAAGTNPRRNWDDQGDWEGGATKVNNRTKDSDGTLRAPTRFAVSSFNDGDHSGTQGTSALTLPITTDFTGETGSSAGGGSFVGFDKLATRIIPTKSGHIVNATVFSVFAIFPSPVGDIRIYNDVGGEPGTDLGQGNTVLLTAGTPYWIVELYSPQTNNLRRSSANLSGGDSRYKNGAGAWTNPGHPIRGQYTFCSSAIPASGIWTSVIYDTFSGFMAAATLAINHSGTYSVASQCSGSPTVSAQTTVEGSNVVNFAGGAQVSQTINNVNGVEALTITDKRYWRIKITLTTTDNRATPTVGLPILTFGTVVTWESESIDTTSQSIAYPSLVKTNTTPSGTSVVMYIATSANIAGPWTGSGNADGQFGSYGSHIVRRYVRVRLVLTTDASNENTPVVSSLVFKWTISAKYVSTIIDTGVNPPAGWDLFLADYETNGGSVSFEMRSATTSGGIAGATFYAVLPGEFPTGVSPNQFTQWRVTLVADDEDVPQVDSVTIQWFISLVASIRPASIFVDGRYYVALAELGDATNTVLLQIDLNGKWRRMTGLAINTFSYFFNRPYFGLSTSGQIRRFLDGITDAGTNISFDWRTKATDFSTKYQDNVSKVKVVGEVILNGVNTGAAFQLYYSIDGGVTFVLMYTSDGLTTYTSTTDEQNFFVRFRPLWDGSNPISGRTIMYRVYSNDANPVEVVGLECTAFLRKQAPVTTG
jgi:hypothetical protein